jgi:UDP-2-acetamido-3-amino-2,3-dideoxy-glucuronate N-acetyltransferase
MSRNYFKHETAVIDEGAKIGNNTKIWHWTHISSKVKIGDDCVFGQNVFIADNVEIGNNVKIQNNVSVYDSVVLEDDVFCGPSMVFTNVYNPRSAISRKDQYLPTIVRKGASIGANATIVCGSVIGKYAFVGAGSVVNKDIPDYALVVGVPAKQIGWMSIFGERLDLPVRGSGEYICDQTNTHYSLQDNCLVAKEISK